MCGRVHWAHINRSAQGQTGLARTPATSNGSGWPLFWGASHTCICSAAPPMTWRHPGDILPLYLSRSVRLESSKSSFPDKLEFPPGLSRKIYVSSCSSSSNFASKCQADGMLRKFLVHVFTIEILAVQLMLLHMCSAHNYQVRARVCTEVKVCIYLV